MGVRNLRAWSSLVKEGFEKSLWVGKLFCWLHVTNTYVCTAALTYGPSMVPTLNVWGDLVLAERISTALGKVGPGDIVLVRSPELPTRIITKRVISMEGDHITYNQNSDGGETTVVVPKGHVWIQGDYIYNSHDSRNFGPVPYSLLQAKVFWRIWPPEHFGSL